MTSGTTTARTRAGEFRAAEAKRRRRRRTGVVAIVVVAVLLVGGLAGGIAAAIGTATPVGPEGMALQQGTPLAADTTSASGAAADGVRCEASEQVAYHVHTHLAVYVDGTLRSIPGGVGIVQPAAQAGGGTPFYGATQCYYWLHVHTQDGVIHIEAPTTAAYTLGQFFAVWQQPLTSSRVAGAMGTVTAFVDGKRVTGDPTAIRLGSRESIQLDVGSVEPWHAVDWSGSSL